jgi:hypothetical protein
VYGVGFKDVYPWVWSVMLGVSLMLAERRGAFQSVGTKTGSRFWLKNPCAVAVIVAMPSFFFGLTMIRVGPSYQSNMGLSHVLGTLHLAGAPLGCHHVWEAIAAGAKWAPEMMAYPETERDTRRTEKYASLVWAFVAFVVPAAAALLGWRVPW